MAMQGENYREGKQLSWTRGSLDWVAEPPNVQGSFLFKADLAERDGIREASLNGSIPVVDVPQNNFPFQEEEMLSWLRYPLDDSLEKNYCSDFFGDLPNSSLPLLKDSFPDQKAKECENPHSTVGSSICNDTSHSARHAEMSSSEEDGIVSKATSADAAMVLGAGRATGLISQAGAEAFIKVRTIMQPSASKCPSNNLLPNNTKSLDVLTSDSSPQNQNLTSPESSLAVSPASSQAKKASDVPEATGSRFQSAKPGMMNFLHFLRPVAEAKANLHIVGVSSGPTNIERVRQQNGNLGREGYPPGESSIAESISTTVMSDTGSCKDINLPFQGQETNQCVIAQRLQLPTSPLLRQETDAIAGKNLEQDHCFNSSISTSTVTATDNVTYTPGAPELTVTSPSRGSGNSIEKSVKESASSSKRKMSQVEDSEYQSEDAEDVATNSKKPPPCRSGTAKRSRAAEVHNESEKRRRDRINEKMKALQELIPNANKSDKASMLDEAIEYLKMLQSQIQLMSMRTGIGIPPMMIPMGLQHLQVQQMPICGPHMGVGMGMEVGMALGMGMGLTNVGVAASGHAMVPMQPLPGQALPRPAHHAIGFQPSTSSLKAGEAYVSPQVCQQLQPIPMNLNMHMDVRMYNAFMQQQQQQQCQQDQHPQQ